MGTQAAGSRSDPEVVKAVIRLGHTGMTYAQIERELERLQADDGPLCGRSIVDAKTIGRIVQANPPKVAPKEDTSGTWSLLEDDSDDPRPILDALAAVLQETAGRKKSVTKAEAELIIKVARAAPDLTPFLIWRMARMYVVRRLNQWPSDDLDALLAFAPWRDGEEGWLRYQRAADERWIVKAAQSLTADLGSGEWNLFGPWAWRLEWVDTGQRLAHGRADRPPARRSEDLDITDADVQAAGEGSTI